MTTKTQHTPGPWLFDFETDRISSRNPPTLICEVFYSSEDSIDGDPESHANARLIAAAPELLAMLKRLVKAIDRMPANPLDGLAEDASALIAKAEGE